MSSPYSRPARVLHWAVAVLLAGQFLVSLLMPDIGHKTVPGLLIHLHFSLGLLILLLMWVRLGVRRAHPVPLDPTTLTAPLEARLALGTHRLFYAVLVSVPLLGWVAASAHGLPVQFFGLPLPALVADGWKPGHTAGDVHGWIMWGLLGLVGLHVAGALFHRFVRRDDVLARMLG